MSWFDTHTEADLELIVNSMAKLTKATPVERLIEILEPHELHAMRELMTSELSRMADNAADPT